MSARKRNKQCFQLKKCLVLSLLLFSPGTFLFAADCFTPIADYSLAHVALAKQLGWVISDENNCCGYYIDPPFPKAAITSPSNASVEITGEQGFISQVGTSVLETNVMATRRGEQITANKAFLYRDPTTLKLTSIEVIGDVHLREPTTLVIAKRGRYILDTRAKSLLDISYRTILYQRNQPVLKITPQQLELPRKITALTAWGEAREFDQNEPKVYELHNATFSTCPPITTPAWQVRASRLVINKNTGRGYATHARVYVKNIPVFYFPYLNFSIDHQRKSGFLTPTFGGGSNKWGPYILMPFYWNMAPNYDMTITPGLLTRRGFWLQDQFRYLTPFNVGRMNLSVLPHDRFFEDFQDSARKKTPDDEVTRAEINRLLESSTTRRGFFWRDNSQYNDHWSSHIDFNYASDDYYYRDFGNLNQITKNQLLQEGDLYYKDTHWNFIGRVQSYQTLHPYDEPPVLNQYRRLPQLILNADYPDQIFGLEFFASNEVTHFELLKTPGTTDELPVGNRSHVQPGVSLPLFFSAFYITPRLQLALTEYNLHQVEDQNFEPTIKRALPIFDVASGTAFTRDIALFGNAFQQTLEPQVYYTYIPYRNQSNIPIFDTSLNTLTYDQLFNYNRFTGNDRIGDANQIGAGITTRLLDSNSGFEKVRFAIGEIVYFANRRVTLCTKNQECPDNPANEWSLSPISAVLNYYMNPAWSLTNTSIWNPISKQMDNSTIGLHYQTAANRIINIGYSYVHIPSTFVNGVKVSSSDDNLHFTDFSFAWPLIHDISMVGRWSEDWHAGHFQNLFFGLQYDTCCWAMRFVGGRAFTHVLSTNNSPQYNSEVYLQFALKGLGNIGTSNPTGLLGTIAGYNTKFGQEL